MQSQLTSEQIKTIQATIPAFQANGEAITRHFYDRLLNDHPELNNIFNRANQENFHQAASLASVLSAYASNIDNVGVLTPALEKINHKHASLFVQPGQYDLVGKYLLKALADVLGNGFTADIHDAWAAAYGQLAAFMIERERQIHGLADKDWDGWRDFEIVRKVEESDEITSFYLQPLQQSNSVLHNDPNATAPLPSYFPGQYISVRVKVPKLGYYQPRQYSLSDAYGEHVYRISVKKEAGPEMNGDHGKLHPGYVSNVLHQDKNVGDIIQVSHPYGEFGLKDGASGNSTPIVLLAAGVGITPMMSMLKTLCNVDSKRSISLIHGAHTTRSRAFYSDIKTLAELNGNVRCASFIKSPDSMADIAGKDYDYQGRIQLGRLEADKWLYTHDSNAEYYICGPTSFMTDMEAELEGMGVEQSRIHMEVFGATVV